MEDEKSGIDKASEYLAGIIVKAFTLKKDVTTEATEEKMQAENLGARVIQQTKDDERKRQNRETREIRNMREARG